MVALLQLLYLCHINLCVQWDLRLVLGGIENVMLQYIIEREILTALLEYIDIKCPYKWPNHLMISGDAVCNDAKLLLSSTPTSVI